MEYMGDEYNPGFLLDSSAYQCLRLHHFYLSHIHTHTQNQHNGPYHSQPQFYHAPPTSTHPNPLPPLDPCASLEYSKKVVFSPKAKFSQKGGFFGQIFFLAFISPFVRERRKKKLVVNLKSCCLLTRLTRLRYKFFCKEKSP